MPLKQAGTIPMEFRRCRCLSTPGLSLVCEGLDLGARPGRKRHCKKALTQRHIIVLNKVSKINSSPFTMDAFLP